MSLLSQYCIFLLTRKTVAAVICLLTPIYEEKFALLGEKKKPLPNGNGFLNFSE